MENSQTPVVSTESAGVTEPVAAPSNEVDQMTTLRERSLAALSYVGFFAIVPFYLKKDSKFCRFHGKQGMLIAIIFFFIKLLLVLDLFSDLALILQFVVFLYGGFAALSGKWQKMPYIYDTACELEKQLSLSDESEEAAADSMDSPNANK